MSQLFIFNQLQKHAEESRKGERPSVGKPWCRSAPSSVGGKLVNCCQTRLKGDPWLASQLTSNLVYGRGIRIVWNVLGCVRLAELYQWLHMFPNAREGVQDEFGWRQRRLHGERLGIPGWLSCCLLTKNQMYSAVLKNKKTASFKGVLLADKGRSEVHHQSRVRICVGKELYLKVLELKCQKKFSLKVCLKPFHAVLYICGLIPLCSAGVGNVRTDCSTRCHSGYNFWNHITPHFFWIFQSDTHPNRLVED